MPTAARRLTQVIEGTSQVIFDKEPQVSEELAWVIEGLFRPVALLLWGEPIETAPSWRTRVKHVNQWLQRHAWIFTLPSDEQYTTVQRCCRSCSSLAVQEATMAALQGHRDHKAVVRIAFPVAGAETAKDVLGVTGPSASHVVQRSSACAVLALLSALSLTLQGADDPTTLLIVHTISVALSNLLHYCLVVQACTTTAANNTRSLPEVVVPHTPAQLVAPARMGSAGVGLTGTCGALDGQALIQLVTAIAQQELLNLVRDVGRGMDELENPENPLVYKANALCACLAKFCERFDAAASKATADIIQSGDCFAVS